MTWAEVLEVLCNDTLQFANKLSTKGKTSEGLNDWVVDYESESAFPKKEFEETMETRYQTLIIELEVDGLGWRTDSRVLKKYLRTGKPGIDSIKEMMVIMRFLHDKTPYKFIKNGIYPPSTRMQYEPVTRMQSVNYFLEHGGDESEIPAVLLKFWKEKQNSE